MPSLHLYLKPASLHPSSFLSVPLFLFVLHLSSLVNLWLFNPSANLLHDSPKTTSENISEANQGGGETSSHKSACAEANGCVTLVVTYANTALMASRWTGYPTHRMRLFSIQKRRTCQGEDIFRSCCVITRRTICPIIWKLSPCAEGRDTENMAASWEFVNHTSLSRCRRTCLSKNPWILNDSVCVCVWVWVPYIDASRPYGGKQTPNVF